MNFLKLSMFKKPLLMAAFFSFAALIVVFMFLKESSKQNTQAYLKNYLNDWNYEFSDDAYHKKDYRLMKKALKHIKRDNLEGFSVRIGDDQVYEWSRNDKLNLASSSCIPLERSIRISAGPKVGKVSFCISEARIILNIFKGILIWALAFLFIIFLGLSAIIPLRGYKFSLTKTLGSLKKWEKDPSSTKIEYDKSDKVSAEILELFNKGIEAKHQFHDLQIEGQEKEAMVGMARKVVHDIKSPISSINEVLSDVEDLNVDSYDFKVLKEASTRLTEFSTELLSETRQRYSFDNSELVDVVPLVNTSIEQLKRPNQSISFQVEGGRQLVAKVFPSDFKRIITNLVKNSVEAIGDKKDGAILVSLEKIDESFSRVTITDNGCGIKTENLDKVFKSGFSTGKKDGNGLGLSSAREKVEIWGGELLLSSKENKGTSIQIMLKNSIKNKVDTKADQAEVKV